MNVAVSAAIMGVCNTVIQLVASFGVSITPSQNAAITGLANSILVLAAMVEHYRIKANGAQPKPPAPGA